MLGLQKFWDQKILGLKYFRLLSFLSNHPIPTWPVITLLDLPQLDLTSPDVIWLDLCWKRKVIKARWRQSQGKVSAKSGQSQGKVKVMWRQGQGNVKWGTRQGESMVKVRSRQCKQNLNCNYNLMGFDTIEINLIKLTKKCFLWLQLYI